MTQGMAREGWRNDGSVHRLVEHWAASTPDAVAVAATGREVTYRELNARANAVARALRGAGAGLESRVAVALPRGVDSVLALLAVLKSGAAYVPVDPDYPAQRRSFMLADAGASVVLTTGTAAAEFADGDRAVVTIDSAVGGANGADGGRAEDNLDVPVRPDNLAYVVYTSGSTGTPKGVMVDHRSVLDLVLDDPRLAVAPGDTVAQFAPIAFDASTFEIWAALCRGGRVAVLDGPRVSIEELSRQLQAWRPDWLFLTTGLFHLLADFDADALRSVGCLLTGGDVLSPQHIRTCVELAAPRVFAAYGPTETTTFASLHRAGTQRYERIPIGSPLRGSTMYVLDADLRPVADGEVGELYIGGNGVARGYHRRPALTAERFLPDPFAGTPGARMYRSGDLAKRRADGEFEFHGRVDRQVKVRGFRIELGEIEAMLNAYPHAGGAVVVAIAGVDNDKRLAAYLVPAPGAHIAVSDLRAWLAERLPEFAVPATFVVLDRLPVDPNGKIDRSALPYPWKSRDQIIDLPPLIPPRIELERVIASTWAEALELDRVGVDDNFFELGGDSLRSVSVLERLRAQGIEFTAGDFFGSPTVAELARLAQRAPALPGRDRGAGRGMRPATTSSAARG
jgi:amino acid adenylation domain-containing protein